MLRWRHMFDADRARGRRVWLGLVVLLGAASSCRRTSGEAADKRAKSSVLAAGPVVHGELPRSLAEPDGAIPRAAESTTVRAAVAADAGNASEPVGGRWVSCYANFRATSRPERDVERLAASCGPPNGMVPDGPIAAGDAGDVATDHRLEARAGDCFRIFAVADSFVGDLGVEVINPRGNAVTWDRNGDRWPILNPDGPFCLFEAGIFTVRVRALQGRGRYAMQVWRLPAPP
jgi:hypothetical protein